jgi:hypothetical protein
MLLAWTSTMMILFFRDFSPSASSANDQAEVTSEI